MNPEQTVSTHTVARFLLLTVQRVRQLSVQGVLEKAKGKDGTPLRGRFNLLACVNGYIRFSRDKQRVSTESDYVIARARRMVALAAVEELRLKRIHGELHHRDDVEFLMTHMFTAFKAGILATPSRCAPGLVGKTNVGEIAEALRVELYAALNELSEYDPQRFEAANEEYLASIGAGRPGPDVQDNKGTGDKNAEKP